MAADAALACLRFLARARARAELDVGRGLMLFGRGRRFDQGELGHSHFDDFCSNRLGFSGALGRELRLLASSLETLPRLREAFLAALLSRSKLRPLLGVVTPEDEAGWAQQARRLGTRDLEQLVADVRAGRRKAPLVADGAGGFVDEEEQVFVSWRVSGLERRESSFKSRGGPDDPWNLTGLCAGCHRLVHLGFLSSTGRAPDGITWTIGRGEARETWRNERRVRAPESAAEA